MKTATCIAMSDTCLLLINNGSEQLLLFDLSLSESKPTGITWSIDTYGTIRDICWSNHINSFLILGDDVLCSYSPISNLLAVELKSPSIDHRFWSLTVLGCDTYILYRYDTLYRYCLPSWTLTRSWSRTDLINIYSTDKFIQLIRAHPSMGTIALLIRLKHDREWRIDLFDRRMQKLFTGQLLRMGSTYPNVSFQPFGENGQWTLMNEDYIWKIGSNGYIIERRSREKNDTTVQ